MSENSCPVPIASLIAGYQSERVTTGESGAGVFRLTKGGSPTLFLKCSLKGADDVRAEAERLRWLAGRAPVPEVIAFASDITQHYLLLQALPGQDGKQTAPEHADAVVTAFARALRQLHDLPIDECPFDERLAVRIEQARARARAGLVDEDDLDKERRGRSAMELLEQLEREDLPDEDLVVTHGDACLPNAIFDGESFSGFVDCGGAGVADRYQDLALAARSISGNLGVEWVHRFFEAYGLVDPDSSKIAYYRLLDEFF